MIFQTIPNDINLTAGVITEVPQTPLSHVNLRAQQNQIPNAYIDSASTISEIMPLLGEYVRYEVTPDGYVLTPATQEEAEDYLESSRPTSASSPSADLSIEEITPLTEIAFDDAIAFGAKAANVAELSSFLPEGMAPDGYAVPFFFYDVFMKHNDFYEKAAAMIEASSFQEDPEQRREALSTFRAKIKEGDILLAVGSRELTDSQSFTNSLIEASPEEPTTVRLWRDGRVFNVSTVLTER